VHDPIGEHELMEMQQQTLKTLHASDGKLPNLAGGEFF